MNKNGTSWDLSEIHSTLLQQRSSLQRLWIDYLPLIGQEYPGKQIDNSAEIVEIPSLIGFTKLRRLRIAATFLIDPCWDIACRLHGYPSAEYDYPDRDLRGLLPPSLRSLHITQVHDHLPCILGKLETLLKERAAQTKSDQPEIPHLRTLILQGGILDVSKFLYPFLNRLSQSCENQGIQFKTLDDYFRSRLKKAWPTSVPHTQAFIDDCLTEWRSRIAQVPAASQRSWNVPKRLGARRGMDGEVQWDEYGVGLEYEYVWEEVDNWRATGDVVKTEAAEA